MALALVARRFTVAEYDRMVAAGVLGPEERLELIEGVITPMAPIGFSHAACVDRIARRLTLALGSRAWVRVQGPIHLPDESEVVPDVAILRRRADDYASGHASATDVVALIEVADTSADRDRLVKLPLYGRAGIPLVWLVDLVGDVILVARAPGPGGEAIVDRVRRGESLTLDPFPDVILTSDEVLGKRSG